MIILHAGTRPRLKHGDREWPISPTTARVLTGLVSNGKGRLDNLDGVPLSYANWMLCDLRKGIKRIKSKVEIVRSGGNSYYVKTNGEPVYLKVQTQ